MSVSAVTPLPFSAGSPRFAAAVRQMPPAEQRRAVAQQFEAILLRQLLGPTLQALPGAGADIYGYMLTDALAQKLSAGGGFGFARLLERQFTPPGESAPAAPTTPVSADAGAPTPASS
ncbi:MAG: rod-binding protein [Opitutaceae bacterium]|nr:rod-binding protein [Opitutaceae bacterium]